MGAQTRDSPLIGSLKGEDTEEEGGGRRRG